MRFFLDISYKGTLYHGWQIQNNVQTVQGELEMALGKLMRSETPVTGSGRTDTGVHAYQQVAHFDTGLEIEPDQIVYKLNSILPPDIVINKCRGVVEDAHARFSAIERGYEYVIALKKTPFASHEQLFVPYSLNIDLMNEASSKLLGKQDFESFSRVKTEVNHFYCDIRQAKWELQGDQLKFIVKADRFLRGMIRALVGTLIDVGRGKLSVEDFVAILEAKDRRKAGKSASPDGLYLNRVVYPKEIFI